jgi:hypothetical protein
MSPFLQFLTTLAVAYPQDEIAKALRTEMLAKLGKSAAPAVLPTPQVPAASIAAEKAHDVAMGFGY